MIDLKIAEALGIPIVEYLGQQFPQIVQWEHCAVCYSSLKGGFIFDLTGPDAGNTREIIEKKLSERNLSIKTYVYPLEVSLTRVSIFEPSVGGVRLRCSAEASTPALALREAAAKALGVDNGLL